MRVFHMRIPESGSPEFPYIPPGNVDLQSPAGEIFTSFVREHLNYYFKHLPFSISSYLSIQTVLDGIILYYKTKHVVFLLRGLPVDKWDYKFDPNCSEITITPEVL